jgi:uncharacterized protein YmfQ (DUF2313 family)
MGGMMRSAVTYRDQLSALFPQGAAWARDIGSAFDRLLGGVAQEFARIDGRAATLIEEVDPLTTLELLGEWERVAALPDSCAPSTASIRDRQIAVARKISGLGGQTPAFFVALAASLGVEVRIEEFQPFTAGMRCGLPCYSADWRFAFRVRVSSATETTGDLRFASFRAGVGRAGERLRTGGIASLECLIRRTKPAHSYVLFAYPQEPEPVLWFDFLNQPGA